MVRFTSLATLALVSSASAFAPAPDAPSSSALKATTFDRTALMPGLPPAKLLEKDGYTPTMDSKLKLEEALTFIKTTLEENLKKNVNLSRVSCPMFVTRASGFNGKLPSSGSVPFILLFLARLYTKLNRPTLPLQIT